VVCFCNRITELAALVFPPLELLLFHCAQFCAHPALT